MKDKTIQINITTFIIIIPAVFIILLTFAALIDLECPNLADNDHLSPY